VNVTQLEGRREVGTEKRLRRLPWSVGVPLVVIAIFVLVATVVDAVRQDSWGPVWMNAWVPAVLLASLYQPAAGWKCWPPLRGGRTRS
jgi:hypothetical protein